MNEFELKVKIGTSEIELKGQTKDVMEAYKEIREDLLIRQITAPFESIDGGEEIEQENLSKSNKTIGKSKTKVTALKRTAKYVFVDLDEKFDEPKFFEDFSKLNLKKAKEQILIAAYLYKMQTEQQTFNIDLIHTLLNKVAIDTPPNLSQMLANYVNIDKLLERQGKNEFKFKHVGSKYCLDTIVKLETLSNKNLE